MLRELSQTLLDLHTAMEQMARGASRAGASIRLTGLELDLPVEARVIFADGGCRLLTDMPRSRTPGALAAPLSRLTVSWEQRPVDERSESLP
jgi:hypothetical protein